MPSTPRAPRSPLRWVGLVAGPTLALAAWAWLPASYVGVEGVEVPFTPAGRLALALMLWMGTWWLTEAVDVAVTALLPLVFLPLTGARTLQEVAAPYAHPLIFLFAGGFLMALSMQRWGLDRRIALLTLRVVGTRPASLVGGFMLATAVLSACVSNTATTAMMLPIALSILHLVVGEGAAAASGRPEHRRLATCLMLAIAYAASIGGLATLIGSPTNGIFAGNADEHFGDSIGFLEWLGVGLPVAAVMLPATWWYLTRVAFRVGREPIEGSAETVRASLAGMGPVRAGEWTTLAVFLLAALGWMTRPLLERLVPGLSDAGIAVAAGLALFALPVGPGRAGFALDWPILRKLPVGILVLFGGGLSLALTVHATGVADFLGSRAAATGELPPLATVLAITAAMIFLTELTSNTATAATMLPILASLAPALGLHPYELMVPATLGASCAFMMPVATPPNAIVFSSGYVTVPQMCRAGFALNLVAIAVVTGATFPVVRWVLGAG